MSPTPVTSFTSIGIRKLGGRFSISAQSLFAAFTQTFELEIVEQLRTLTSELLDELLDSIELLLEVEELDEFEELDELLSSVLDSLLDWELPPSVLTAASLLRLYFCAQAATKLRDRIRVNFFSNNVPIFSHASNKVCRYSHHRNVPYF